MPSLLPISAWWLWISYLFLSHTRNVRVNKYKVSKIDVQSSLNGRSARNLETRDTTGMSHIQFTVQLFHSDFMKITLSGVISGGLDAKSIHSTSHRILIHFVLYLFVEN